MRQDKDRINKWLIARYADSILHLAGITGFSAWKHLLGEVVTPRRLLDSTPTRCRSNWSPAAWTGFAACSTTPIGQHSWR